MRKFVLLFAAAGLVPAAEGISAREHLLFSFTLKETPAQVLSRFAHAPTIGRMPGYTQYQFHVYPSLQAVAKGDRAAFFHPDCSGRYPFSVSFTTEGEMVSVIFQPPYGERLASFFPPDATVRREVGKVTYLTRMIQGGRVLAAVLASPALDEVDQVVLTTPAMLPRLYPALR